jgi:hypothetical protein
MLGQTGGALTGCELADWGSVPGWGSTVFSCPPRADGPWGLRSRPRPAAPPRPWLHGITSQNTAAARNRNLIKWLQFNLSVYVGGGTWKRAPRVTLLSATRPLWCVVHNDLAFLKNKVHPSGIFPSTVMRTNDVYNRSRITFWYVRWLRTELWLHSRVPHAVVYCLW